MKCKLGLALAIAAGLSAPAAAGDFGYGTQGYGAGIKDTAPGVPVPAPVPVYETFRWYLRADVGGGWRSAPSVKQEGLTYGLTDSKTPFSPGSSWFSSDFDTFYQAGLGAGVYLTPRLRGDITVDGTSDSRINGEGAFAYNQYQFTPLPATDTGLIVRGTMTDHTSVNNTTSLVNLYYDLTDRGRFTPYIGLGAGFVVRNVNRTHTTTETLYDPGTGTSTSYAVGTVSANKRAHLVAPAAAATAGFSYAISPGVLVDVNYRLTYLGAVDTSMQIAGQASKLTIGDTLEHSIRAGLRWNVW